MGDPRRTLGVHLAAGIAYLALLEGESPIIGAPPKIEPSSSLKDGERLEDFSRRFGELAQSFDIQDVVVAKPRMMNKWKYSDAFERSVLEACIMLAANQSSFAYTSLAQKTISARIGIGMTRFEAELPSAIGAKRETHWKQRAVAFAAALALLRERAK
jgi:hypothetical protein